MPLDNTGWPEIGDVTVKTSSDGGFGPEHWSERCTSHIVSISDKAPQPIRAQAYAFRELVEASVRHYMKQAIQSDRATLAAELRKQGHADIADIIVRL